MGYYVETWISVVKKVRKMLKGEILQDFSTVQIRMRKIFCDALT